MQWMKLHVYEKSSARESKKDLEYESRWAIDCGFNLRASVGSCPCDLPSLIRGMRKRTVNGVEVPCPLDHLYIYRNQENNQRAAVFHEYPPVAKEKELLVSSWCERNGLEFEELEYSWYYPGVTKTYMITAKKGYGLNSKRACKRAYSRRLYSQNPKRSFMTSIRSYQKILTTLGYSITEPDKEALDAAVNAYLEARPRRERIDAEA